MRPSSIAMISTATLIACASPKHAPPPREPPPRVIAAKVDRVSVRANAYVELHAWLAAAARSQTQPPNELEPAADAYARELAGDDRDERLERTTRALAVCVDDRCAGRALAATAMGGPYERALPLFVKRYWSERASAAHAAIEAARAAFGVETEAIGERIAEGLAIAWPEDPVPVDFVSEAPPAGRQALLPVVIGARGSCFAHTAKESVRVQYARIVDCVLVRALLELGPKSRLYAALGRELGPQETPRAWELVVIHAVAATVTGWEPGHVSVTRRSAAAVAREPLTWLAESWRERANGHETVEAFAARYAAKLRERR